ncbi:MAG: HD domain-containing protein [Clostridia bacterium]|nr:HD domain-containing protein [Clostridia bacterium]
MQDTSRYAKLSKNIQSRILEDRKNHWENPYRCKDEEVIRRDNNMDVANLWRPPYVRDIEKILHLPYYNRYTDKTQVFSFYHNDDISRRALHVQLVSRIARNIGAVLGLNQDLIEAISLGHDIGHTPFGHAGEAFLSEILKKETGRAFNHNVQSTRVLDVMFNRNLSLQTLDGILCHNGEFEQQEYRPSKGKTFETFDKEVEDCYVLGASGIEKLVPMTLEGCVVRICDMIAYLGKDRQDAQTAKLIDADYKFTTERIGTQNAKMINNLIVDIIENSYGKDHILLSQEAYMDLKLAKKENYQVIYHSKKVSEKYEVIGKMFNEVYYKLLLDLERKDESSVIYRHHINYVEEKNLFYKGTPYREQEKNQIVTDFIASMTDDYFIELHNYLFPDSPNKIQYISYFKK